MWNTTMKRSWRVMEKKRKRKMKRKKMKGDPLLFTVIILSLVVGI